MSEGVDYSGDRPNPICMRSKDKRFVGRYFGPGGAWKHATAAECAAIIAAGMSVFAIAEGETNGALGGSALGAQHAAQANAAATAAGMPPDRPIYFAVDFDMVTSQRSAVASYLHGASSVIGFTRVGVYGGIRTVDWARTSELASWSWQTYAWSSGQWSGLNHIEQYSNGQTVCGGKVDLCRSKVNDFGQWPHPTESFGTVPDSAAPVVTSGPWDYTGEIAGQAGDLRSGAGSLSQYARDMDSLRYY